MNKVILAGRLARDPEVRYTNTGKAVATFTLAVNRRFGRNQQGADQQPTADFIPCVAWEKLAEICGNNLVKGSQILVEGRMQVRSYEAQDGSKRWATDVVVNELEFMGSKPQRDGMPANNGGFGAPTSGGPSVSQPANSPAPAGFGAPAGDDDIPF